MTNSKFQYGMIPLHNSFVLKSPVDSTTIDLVNKYLDKLQESKSKKSHAYSLVGQIRQRKESQQLTMDHTDPDCLRLGDYILSSAEMYVHQYGKLSPKMIEGDRIPSIDEMWSVHSYEGDYNTLHTHGCKTLMGISTVLWTKVPKQISDKPAIGNLKNASGDNDGFLCFVFGGGDVTDTERLKFSGYTPIKPEVGVMYTFPNWLQHLVWPFFGEGERRTVASNVNMFRLEQLSPEHQQLYKKMKAEQKRIQEKEK